MKAFLLLILSFFVLTLSAEEPSRETGLSVHMLPDRVAKLSGRQGGFTLEGNKPALRTAEELIAHLDSLPKKTQASGIWLVTTHPSSYSQSEKARLEELARLCAAGQIPLFICQGSQLPDGWKRKS